MDERIEAVDAIRRARPDQFRENLAAQNAEREAIPARLLERLDNLNAYRRAYEGDYESAISLATLFRIGNEPSLRFRAGLLIVNSYATTREFQVGLRILDRLLTLIDALEDEDLRTKGLVVAAIFCNRLGQCALGSDWVLKRGRRLRAFGRSGRSCRSGRRQYRTCHQRIGRIQLHVAIGTGR